jgi:hypothetical protein
MLEIPPEWLAHEYYQDDFHKAADVARSERGVSTLHEATGGDPSRSPGWKRYVHPYGGDQELLLALRTSAGEAWGILGLYRAPNQPLFDAEEIRFLRELSPYLGEGARRGLLVGEATDPEGAEAPGLIVLREDWSVESHTPVVSSRQPCYRWPGAPSAPRCSPVSPARLRSHACWRTAAGGWCCTAPRW